MIKELNICGCCMDLLTNYGSPVRDLYLDICCTYTGGKISYCKSNDEGDPPSMIKFMIEKRFLDTTDCHDNLLAIKPIGCIKDNNVVDICAYRDLHEDN